jgi:hypothetical protein
MSPTELISDPNQTMPGVACGLFFFDAAQLTEQIGHSV